MGRRGFLPDDLDTSDCGSVVLCMLSDHHDLRGGSTVWTEGHYDLPLSDELPNKCDVAIIGAGIMGATLAERLTAEGYSIVLLDRRPPAHGSTAASTAEVMWAMDVPLCALAASIGEREAIRRWTRVFRAVHAFAERIDALGIDCGRADRPTVYLAGTLLDEDGLRREAALHRSADLPTTFLDAPAIAERFAIAPRAGLVSTKGFEVEPTRLTLGFLDYARERGARVIYPCDVVALTPDNDGLRVSLADGRTLSAGEVIFAGGYERAPLFLPPAFGLLSTFVMATAPLADPLWRERAMIWEASDPYLYIRTCMEGRVIAGGEDVGTTDPSKRNALIGQKAGTIAAKTAALLGHDEPLPIDRQWSAMFGSSPDGLPAIGPVSNLPHAWIAAGYGGNGIAFAALAAEIIAAGVRGERDADARCFDPYRFA